MCGLTGFLQPGGFSAETAKITAEKMALRIIHRGPDDGGVWMDAGIGLAVAHRRLSILDLSPAGHQPMVSGSGRFVIAFNGEIYNHLDLRHQLGEQAWRGHSDTETLLAGFDAWGIEATLKKSVGMFAIALWDRRELALYLVRDRIGEKPLYYGWQGGVFLFGSELKALKAHPVFEGKIDRDALTLLLKHNYIPTPYSIFRGIRKLPPATYLRITAGMRECAPVPYWSLSEVAELGQAQPFPGSEAEAVEALERILRDAVRLQQIADVPLGAFLSGGVDSSAVVALMQAQSSRPIKTFTIGFHEQHYDEAEHAKAVARHLGTDHTELYVTPDEAMSVIPRLPALYDEPFSDSSQIPTFLVSQLARQHVTVSLSGDAGDELFGGYNRYVLGQKFWGNLSRLPTAFRIILARIIQGVNPHDWNRLLGPIQRFLPLRLAQANIGDKLHKGARVISAKTPTELYRLLASHWDRPSDLVMGGSEPPTLLTDSAHHPKTDHWVHYMMALDMLTYLPDDILCKVDRAAMGVSLETRVPFLDHRLVEFSWRLPLSYKVRGGIGKWLLRQVLYRYVPKELIERPKMGFSVPIDKWLRGPLRDWAEDLLNENRLTQESFFNPKPIRLKWREHLSGQRNWQHHLWDVLMFQAWLKNERTNPIV